MVECMKEVIPECVRIGRVYGCSNGGMLRVAVVERERSSATVVSVSGVTVVLDRQW